MLRKEAKYQIKKKFRLHPIILHEAKRITLITLLKYGDGLEKIYCHIFNNVHIISLTVQYLLV